jgi:small subunit ribosomal protein S14
MAKKSMLEREKKRAKMVAKYAAKMESLKDQLASTELSQPTRQRNRCWLTGRSRGYYRDFGLSRHVFREMAHQGLLPGVTKSSW